MNRPNLFLVGAMKSGTTYLHELLAEHPSIFMSAVKEPCHFVSGEDLKRNWPQMWRMGYWENQDKYMRLFDESNGEKYLGESSTVYTMAPRIGGVPERIHNFNPDARIIYLMRDPVERTISHFWHDVGVTAKMSDIMTALVPGSEYLDVSFYAYQLRSYLSIFDPSKVLAITFEELTQRASQTMKEVFSWLQVDDSFIPKQLETPRNVTPKSLSVSNGTNLLRQLRFSPFWKMIGGCCPKSLRSFGRKLSERQVSRTSVDLTEVRDLLRKIQEPQIDELSILLERNFPEWNIMGGKDKAL